MYSVKLTSENYFTGTYAKTGGVAGGVSITTLPPTTDAIMSLSYRLDKEISIVIESEPKTEIIETLDEYGNTVKTEVLMYDENGELICEDKEIEVTSYKWTFDDVRYNELLEEQRKIEALPTDSDKIEQLKQENEVLKEQLDSLDMTLCSILEEVLPEILESIG